MFYIVETEEGLEKLAAWHDFGCFLEIIESNTNYHPKLTSIVAIYIRPLTGDRGYIIPITHDEGLNQSWDRVKAVLKQFSKVYVLNKKRTLYHYCGGKELIDLGMKQAMTYYNRLDLESNCKTYNWFYTNYGNLPDLGQIIPLTKHYERCEELYSKVENLIKEEEPAGFQFYNELATKVYYLVEQNGLRVDRHGFVEYFKPGNLDYSLDGEIVYNSYNLYNPTSRPTNSFNGVNFLAIPKGQEFRRCFKPQNDYFAELDFDGYHIRLVSEQIGYNLNLEDKAHLQLAKLWHGKENISEVEYGKAKAMNFQIIYGSIPEEYRGLEFTDKVQAYIDQFWKLYRKQGYIENPISCKRFTKELKGMTETKLMNYMVQSLETARNIQVLYKVLAYLSKTKCKTKLELITYDSFLLDTAQDEDEVVQEVKKIMEAGGYPVKVKTSYDLNFD